MAFDTKRREPIRRDESYTISEFMRRTGIGRAGVRSAERQGLKMETVGQRKYVRGDAWFNYLESQRDDADHQPAVECV